MFVVLGLDVFNNRNIMIYICLNHNIVFGAEPILYIYIYIYIYNDNINDHP